MNKREFFFGIDTCYKCDERKVGCHSTCERYILASKEKDEKVQKHKKHLRNTDLFTHGKAKKGSFIDRHFLQT